MEKESTKSSLYTSVRGYDLGRWVQNAAEVCESLSVCVCVCVQMAVCMTAPLTGMNDNGHSNHSPRGAEGETAHFSGVY